MYAKARKALRVASAVAVYRSAGGQRLNYVDVGARGGLPPRWRLAARLGAVRPVLVDPDDAGAKMTIRAALGSQDCTKTLHIAHEPGQSSFLVPLEDSRTEIVAERLVDIRRLDSVWPADLGAPHFFKADVQGYELEVLAGAGALLEEMLTLELEVALRANYAGQPLFNEVYAFATGRGFDLVRTSPNGLEGGNKIADLNAFFVRQNKHDDPRVKMWKRIVDVGTHKRVLNYGH